MPFYRRLDGQSTSLNSTEGAFRIDGQTEIHPQRHRNAYVFAERQVAAGVWERSEVPPPKAPSEPPLPKALKLPKAEDPAPVVAPETPALPEPKAEPTPAPAPETAAERRARRARK